MARTYSGDVIARANGNIKADENVRVMADTRQNLTSMVVGIAASTGGTTGAGSVGVGLIKSTTLQKLVICRYLYCRLGAAACW